MSQSVRRDLMIIAAGVILVFIFELITGIFDVLFYAIDEVHQSIPLVDAGELIAVPLALALGLAYFSYRRYKELSATVAARGAAQRAAAQAQQEAERAQQEAQEAQRLSQTLMDTGMNALVKVDGEGRIVEANEGMEVATGLHSSRLVGTSVFSFFGDKRQARGWFEKSLQGAAVQNETAEIVHQDGGTTRVSYNTMAQRDVGGEITGGILLLRPREEALTS